MIKKNWWDTTLTADQRAALPSLRTHIKTDVLIVGGGMAGLHAALRLAQAGKQVVLIEKETCGASSTGKSAGFLTPFSDMELSHLARRHGDAQARALWRAASNGIARIIETAQAHRFDCDLAVKDSVYLARGRKGVASVNQEAEAHERLGLPHTHYCRKQISEVVASPIYYAGTRYSGTYSFNPLKYAYYLKQHLLSLGVSLYEGTEALDINDKTVTTPIGSVTASHIIFCIDKMRTNLGSVAKDMYAAQTCVAVSEPLTSEQERILFPNGDLMCWDSDIVFSYFRLTPDKRLILGGGSGIHTFTLKETNAARIINGVIRRFKKSFPGLATLRFTHYWPGYIDTTKDLAPIVANDPRNPHVQYVLGCIGLGWAAFCGDYAAQRLLNADKSEMGRYFRMDRCYFVPRWLERLLGKKVSFMMSAFYHKFIESASVES